MAAAKIKKGDRVIVLSGKDKGKTGEVTQALPKDGKVIVSGVNIAIRHTKPSQGDPQGGLVRSEAPLHVSKVAHVTAEGKPSWKIFSKEERERMETIFKLMSRDQQRNSIVIFTPWRKPESKKVPTATQLEDFSNPNKYGVRIDGYRWGQTR